MTIKQGHFGSPEGEFTQRTELSAEQRQLLTTIGVPEPPRFGQITPRRRATPSGVGTRRTSAQTARIPMPERDLGSLTCLRTCTSELGSIKASDTPQPLGTSEDAIAAQRADGHSVSDQAIGHLSPGHYEPINPYGMLNIDVADVVERPRRPIRGRGIQSALEVASPAVLAPLLRRPR